MKKIIYLCMGLMLAACGTMDRTPYDHTAFKQTDPKSILVLPPLNSSPEINATYSALSQATLPLAEAGYYVLPVSLSVELLKNNGIYLGHDAQNISYDKLRKFFGADTALYLNVTKYGSSYRIIDSVNEAAVSAKLVDLKTGKIIWQGSDSISQSTNDNNNSNSLLGTILNAAINQAVNSSTDQAHFLVRDLMYHLLSAGKEGSNKILYGHYAPNYWKNVDKASAGN